jgi:hypothetical protein
MVDFKKELQRNITNAYTEEDYSPGYSPKQINDLIEHEFMMADVPDEQKMFTVDEFGRSITGFKEEKPNMFSMYGQSMIDYSAGVTQGADVGGRMIAGGGKGLVIGLANLGDGVLAPLNAATGGSLEVLDNYIETKPIQTFMRKHIPEEELGLAGNMTAEFARYIPGYVPGVGLASLYTKSLFLKSMASAVLAPWFYGESENPNVASLINGLLGTNEGETKDLARTVIEWADTTEETDTLYAKLKTLVAEGPLEAGFAALIGAIGKTYRYLKNNKQEAEKIATSFNMMENGNLTTDMFGNKYSPDGKMQGEM